MVERRGLTIRAALFLGLGLTTAIWAFAGYRFTERLAAGEHQTSAINVRTIRAQGLLATIRTQVLVGSVYVRDALLEANRASLSEYRTKFEGTWRAVEKAVGRYHPGLGLTEEREGLSQLRRELEAFHTAMLRILTDDQRRWPTDARLLQQEIVSKREVVFNIFDQVQALNRRDYVDRQMAVTSVYGATQRRLLEMLGMALVLTLSIWVWAARYISRLERRIVQQIVEEAESASACSDCRRN